MQEELTVDARNTSRGRNQHHSAVDPRGSATGVGIVGLSLLALVLGFIVVMDAASLVSHVVLKVRHHHQQRSLKVRKSKSSKVKEEAEDAAVVDPVDVSQAEAFRDASSRSHVTASLGGGSDVSGEGKLAEVEVARFAESVAMEAGSRQGQHGVSRRKHLLRVRPDTILLPSYRGT